MKAQHVFKFGGSTVLNRAECIPSMLKNNGAVVVVSAIGKTTTHLMRGEVDAACKIAEAWWLKYAKGAEYPQLVLDTLEQLKGMQPKTTESVSYGEKLSSVLVASYLEKVHGKSTMPLWADNHRIVKATFTGNPFEASVVAVDRTGIELFLGKGIIPVITGYIGFDDTNSTVLLGRDGSDISAVAIANVLGCNCTIVTDVPGIMSADPRIVKDPRPITYIHIDEARELAFHGASVLNRYTLNHIRDGMIIEVVYNTGTGTMITHDTVDRSGPIAVALLRERRIITVRRIGKGKTGFSSLVFGNVSKIGVSVEMIMQTCSETSVSFVVPETVALECQKALRSIGRTTISEPMCVATVVGMGMVMNMGVLATLASTLSESCINIRGVSQGSEELSISFCVENGRADDAVRALHSVIVRRWL